MTASSHALKKQDSHFGRRKKNSKKKKLMHALLVYRVIYGALQLE
jgi:hypothetical protein